MLWGAAQRIDVIESATVGQKPKVDTVLSQNQTQISSGQMLSRHMLSSLSLRPSASGMKELHAMSNWLLWELHFTASEFFREREAFIITRMKANEAQDLEDRHDDFCSRSLCPNGSKNKQYTYIIYSKRQHLGLLGEKF